MSLKRNRAGLHVILTGFLSLVQFFYGFSQEFKTPDEEFAFYRKRYPDEMSVMLTNSRELEIKIKDGKPRVYMTDIEEYLYLQQTPFAGTDEMVHFSSYSRVLDVEAYTLIPDGKSYKKLAIRKFDTIDYRAPGIFHDDSKALKFNFMGVKLGAKTYLKTTIELLEPRLINTFLFNMHVNIEKSVLHIVYPENVELGYKLANPLNPPVQITEQSKGSKRILHFERDLIKKLKSEENAPEFRHLASHVFVYIRSYERDGKRIPVLGTPEDLYRWFVEMGGNPEFKAGPALASVVDSLVSGVEDEQTRISRIFYWVQDHIGYIAFEDGLGAFKPRPADSVFNRRYGDCKDMANLLCTMLRHAGSKAYLTWIGSTDLPYTFTEFPLPSSANHMIVAVKQGGKNIFLDATMRPLAYGFPSVHTQGKEAFIGIDPVKFEIEKVPVVENIHNYLLDTIYMNITNKELNGRGICYFGNYLKHDLVSSLQDKKDQKAKKEFLNSYLSKGNNKFEIGNYEIAGTDTRDKEVKIAYDYVLPAYLTTIGNEYFVNMNLIRLKTDRTFPENRTSPYSLRFNWMVDETVILSVPEDYTVTGLPPDASFTTGLFEYSLSYQLLPGKVIMRHVFREKFMMLMPERFTEWNQMVESLNNAYAKSVVLKRKN